MSSLVVAHLSDLHVSRYGEHVTSLRSTLWTKQGKQDEDWEVLDEVDGWPIQRRSRWRWRLRDTEDALELRLLDDEGYVQQKRKGRRADLGRFRHELAQVAAERHLTEHARLARALPTITRVEQLLTDDPTNTNLLFLRAAFAIREVRPDWLLVTGDVTDDGIGYDLVEAAFAPFIDRGRLLAIPGNHDVYGSPPFVVPSHERKDVLSKRELWAPFARQIGVPPEGPWVREIGEGAVVCAVDSCTPAWTPLSASGEVPQQELERLSAAIDGVDAPVRIAMLHHHVVNPPILNVGRAPWQLGMRLRNAREVYEYFVGMRFSAVLNGHRHLGYRYHPAWAPIFISAPSATLGCRTGARPYFWRLEIRDGELASVRERPLAPT
ncbi:MAG TPA: metallophosphoesterase [Myxococcaceae bacterium]|nr:metallophosphoesterase [Myxococcaceae bacterium]